MPNFIYKAVDHEGITQHGQMDANNVVDLDQRLKRLQLDLISAKATSQKQKQKLGRLPKRELIQFFFHLEQLSSSGVSLIDGLKDLRDSAEDPRTKSLVANILEAIEGGQTMSQAMASYPQAFNSVILELVRAGEISGSLPEVLRRLVEMLRWEDELVSQVQKLLIYPIMAGVLVLGATTFLMVYLVPQLKNFVQNMGQVLPTHTEILFWFSDLLVNYWLILLIAPIALTLALVVYFTSSETARHQLDRIKLRLPFIGTILMKTALSRFVNTFALMYSAGIPIIECLHATQKVVGNRSLERGLIRAQELISDGYTISDAFVSVGLFPPIVVRMLKVGEASGALSESLQSISYFFSRDVDEAIIKAQAMIQPLLTLVLGMVLGWVMFSVLGPLYDVISTVQI